MCVSWPEKGFFHQRFTIYELFFLCILDIETIVWHLLHQNAILKWNKEISQNSSLILKLFSVNWVEVSVAQWWKFVKTNLSLVFLSVFSVCSFIVDNLWHTLARTTYYWVYRPFQSILWVFVFPFIITLYIRPKRLSLWCMQ